MRPFTEKADGMKEPDEVGPTLLILFGDTHDKTARKAVPVDPDAGVARRHRFTRREVAARDLRRKKLFKAEHKKHRWQLADNLLI